jgi:hypothetical protein
MSCDIRTDSDGNPHCDTPCKWENGPNGLRCVNPEKREAETITFFIVMGGLLGLLVLCILINCIRLSKKCARVHPIDRGDA